MSENPIRAANDPLRWMIGVVALLLVVVLAATAIRIGILGRGVDASSLPDYGQIDDFALTEAGGHEVTLAELQGRVWIADFIFTRCRTTCPLMTSEMARLTDELAAGPELRLVSVTVDPEHDTPEVLSGFGRRYGADGDRWLFLTGDKEAIYDLTRRSFHLGVAEAGEEETLLAATGDAGTAGGDQATKDGPVQYEGGEPFIHSTRIVLVDREGTIRGYYDATDPEKLRDLRVHARSLLEEPDSDRDPASGRPRS
jgi:protein SCO1/2